MWYFNSLTHKSTTGSTYVFICLCVCVDTHTCMYICIHSYIWVLYIYGFRNIHGLHGVSSEKFPGRFQFHEVRTIFITILRFYWPFSLSFFHKCTVKFSRGYLTCDIVSDWILKQADMRIQLSSIKLNIKEICKNVKQCYSSFGHCVICVNI